FKLRYQLFTLHMRIERIFFAAIDSFSVLEWLVAVGIGGAAGEKQRAANGDFQQLRFLVARQASLQLLISLHRWQAIFRLEYAIERIMFQIFLQQLLAALKVDLRKFDCQWLCVGEAQAAQAEKQLAGLDAQSFSSCLISRAHLGREDFCARLLAARFDIFCEPGQAYQLLGDLVLADKSAFSLFAVEQTLVDQVRDGLASCHTADAVRLAQLSFSWNEIARLPFSGAYALAHDLFQLVIAG